MNNNVAATTIAVLPDLAGVDDLLYFGTDPGATAPLMMTVRNAGNWPSSGGSLEVYDGLPGKIGTHSLLKAGLPAIQPGRQAGISGALRLTGLPAAGSGPKGIYIKLDPEGVVDESNENNNMVAAGEVLETGGSPGVVRKVFLPFVKR